MLSSGVNRAEYSSRGALGEAPVSVGVVLLPPGFDPVGRVRERGEVMLVQTLVA